MPKFKLPSSKTKLICTIGPASQSQPVLERMIRNGMDIARVNLSHGDLDRHAQTIHHIRAAASAVGERVAIWGDLPGPKMRVGRMKGDTVWLQPGQQFVLRAGEFVGDAARASVSFSGLPQAVRHGDKVHLNDGLIQLEVERVANEEIHCRVLDSGKLGTHDGVNVPGIDLGLSAFTSRDQVRLAFAAAQDLDAVSPSFIQDAADLDAVRQAAAELAYSPFLLAKIERAPAVQNLDSILAVADAVVVARGDLGVETPIEEIALLQKEILDMANQTGTPAITATHMLESMTRQRLPTRAEVADVTNAILDGTDCLTLSAETAVGSHPAEAVAMMARIARAVEARDETVQGTIGLDAGSRDREQRAGDEDRMLELRTIVEKRKPAAIFIPTPDGNAARRLSRLRLPVWIVAVSPDEATCQALQFSYGVYPVCMAGHPKDWEQVASNWLQHSGLAGGMLLHIQNQPPLPGVLIKYMESIGSGQPESGAGA